MTAPATISVERLRELLAKATPGPWAYEDDQTHPNEAIIPLPAGYIECGGSRNRREANAALIAEGITALPALLQQLDDYEMAVMAEAQLADERGETINQLRTKLLVSSTLLAEREAEVAALRANSSKALLEKLTAAESKLAERDADRDSWRRVAERLENEKQVAERAREEATGLLRECQGNLYHPHLSAQMDALDDRIAAFLAASGGGNP